MHRHVGQFGVGVNRFLKKTSRPSPKNAHPHPEDRFASCTRGRNCMRNVAQAKSLPQCCGCIAIAKLFTAASNEYTIKSISETLVFEKPELSSIWSMSYDPVRCAIHSFEALELLEAKESDLNGSLFFALFLRSVLEQIGAAKPTVLVCSTTAARLPWKHSHSQLLAPLSAISNADSLGMAEKLGHPPWIPIRSRYLPAQK